jgi:hypothetical protein
MQRIDSCSATQKIPACVLFGVVMILGDLLGGVLTLVTNLLGAVVNGVVAPVVSLLLGPQGLLTGLLSTLLSV